MKTAQEINQVIKQAIKEKNIKNIRPLMPEYKEIVSKELHSNIFSAIGMNSEKNTAFIIATIQELNINIDSEEIKLLLNYALQMGSNEIANILTLTINQLNESDPNINNPIEKNDSALMNALKKGHVELAKRLIKDKANIYQSDNNGDSPLMIALKHGHIEIAEIIINNDRNEQFDNMINQVNKNGNSALMIALSYRFVALKDRYVQLAKNLIENGANIDQVNNNGNSPLTLISRYGHIEIAEIIIKNMSQQFKEDKLNSALMIAISASAEPAMVKILLDHNADSNNAYYFGQTALMLAVTREQLKTIETLLIHNANPNTRDPFGQTALRDAVTLNHSKTVELLLKYNATIDNHQMMSDEDDDLMMSDEDDQSLLMDVLLEGKFEIAKILIENGADIEKFNQCGETALIATITSESHEPEKGGILSEHDSKIENTRLEVVKKLLERNVDINQTDSCFSKTALMYALLNDKLEIAATLLDHDADINITDRNWQTALMIAASRNQLEMVKTLLRFNATINAVNNKGETALMVAILHKNIDVADILLTHGASINHVNKQNKTISDYVIAADQLEKEPLFAKMILKHHPSFKVKQVDKFMSENIFSYINKVDYPELLEQLIKIEEADSSSDTQRQEDIHNKFMENPNPSFETFERIIEDEMEFSYDDNKDLTILEYKVKITENPDLEVKNIDPSKYRLLSPDEKRDLEIFSGVTKLSTKFPDKPYEEIVAMCIESDPDLFSDYEIFVTGEI